MYPKTRNEPLEGLLKAQNVLLHCTYCALYGVQLLLDRDPHGNVQVAKIETEVLLAHAVEIELAELAAEGGCRLFVSVFCLAYKLVLTLYRPLSVRICLASICLLLYHDCY